VNGDEMEMETYHWMSLCALEEHKREHDVLYQSTEGCCAEGTNDQNLNASRSERLIGKGSVSPIEL
jgi:hypothetical protein